MQNATSSIRPYWSKFFITCTEGARDYIIKKHSVVIKQLLQTMKLTSILILALCLHVSAKVVSQNVTYSGKNVSLQDVFLEVIKQTEYSIVYSEEMIRNAKPVSIEVVDVSMEEILALCLKNQPFKFIIKGLVVSIEPLTVGLPPRSAALPPPITIRGRIVDENGNPVSSASVTVRGSRRGASTNNNGEFELNSVDNNAVLIISGINIEQQEIRLNGRADINISVKIKIKEEEEIVVAYNKTTQRANTGAVTVVKGEAIRELPSRSFDRSLQGMVPGLLITSGNGQPGGGTSNFVIRGIGTGADANFGSSVRKPLIVIDGVPLASINQALQRSYSQNATPVTNDLSSINPADVESFTVLKDAAAIALYGSQASNGVILITTKKGKAGKTKIQFRHQTDISSPVLRKDRMLNASEYLTLLKEAYKNADPVLWTDAAIDADLKSKFPTYTDGSGTHLYDQSDWFSALYSKKAITIDNEIAASGGNEKSQFYVNINYLKQNGTVKNTGFNRIGSRFNFSNRINSAIKFGLNSTVSYTDQRYPGTDESALAGLGAGYTMSPLNPIRLKDNQYNLFPFYYAGSNVNNPIAELEYNTSKTQTFRFIGNVYGEVNIMKDLLFKSNVGSDVLLSQIQEKIDPRLSISGADPGIGSVYNANNFFTRIVNTNSLNYNHSFNQHHFINVLVGEESQVERQKNLTASGQGLNIPSLSDLSATNMIMGASGSGFRTTLLSYLAQANYGHNESHYLTLSARRDGSSKFGPKNRYGNYWSAGFGWIVSNESFVKSTASWLSSAKIRGSIGTSGNSSTIGPYTQFNLLRAGNLNGEPAVTYTPGNPGISWEESFNTDLGLELGLFKRVFITVDVYQRKISHLLYDYKLPGVTGAVVVTQNIGKMQNKGIETSISIDVVKEQNFLWNLNANWSANSNKLIKADVPIATNANLINKEGENFNSYYLVRWGGVNSADGKPRWLDIDGKITENYSIDNRVIVGKPQPDAFGGIINTFKYKGFELGAMLYYQYGNKIYDRSSTFLLGDGNLSYLNQSKDALNRWQKPGDIAKNPRRVLDNSDGGNFDSDRYLFDGDYIRLKYMDIGYNFSNHLLRSMRIERMRVHATANNLFVITKFKGFDPENVGSSGETQFAYPQSRTYSIGIDLTL
jgi:TonB-linked SusC/RagA family outer membrane protein